MARSFTSASSQYLSNSTAAVDSDPLTMAAWVKSSTDATQVMLSIFKDANGSCFISLVDTAGGHVARYLRHKYDAGSSVFADSSSQWSSGAWTHVCGVDASVNSRAVYLNGGSKGTDSTSGGTISGNILTSIGGLNASYYVDGEVAEAAIWNAALTDAEVAILGAGYSPLFVRPANLVFYCPLIRDDDEDLIGGLSLTATNAPTVAAHPRIIYPARQQIITPQGGITVYPTATGMSAGLAQMTGGFQ